MTPEQVLDELTALVRREIDETRTLAAQDHHPWSRFVADGNIKVWSEELSWLLAHRRAVLGPRS